MLQGLYQSAPCGCEMSDYVLLKTDKIYIVTNKTGCIFVVCLLHVVDIHRIKLVVMFATGEMQLTNKQHKFFRQDIPVVY
jgi:uncharacterized pyridoxamine 5'-phosphate oxidase family protein